MPPSQSSTAYRRISSPESSCAGASGTARPYRGSGGAPNEYRISPRLVCEITTFGLVRVAVRVSTLVPVDTARVETRTSRRDGWERRIAGARGIATPRAVIGDMAGGAGLDVLLKSFAGFATAGRTAGGWRARERQCAARGEPAVEKARPRHGTGACRAKSSSRKSSRETQREPRLSRSNPSRVQLQTSRFFWNRRATVFRLRV